MVDGPHGTGSIETVSVINGNGRLTTTSAAASTPTLPSITSSPAAGIVQIASSQIASSHPYGETLPSTGPVTQGEILRQEQEAGIVLSNPHSISPIPPISDAERASTIIDTVEPEEEVPHARGPEIIGMEDTGPQKQSRGLNIEGAVGRPSLEGAKASKSPGPKPEEADDEVMMDSEDTQGEKEKEIKKKEEVKKEEDEDEEMKTAEVVPTVY